MAWYRWNLWNIVCHSMVKMGFSMVHMVSGLVQKGPSRVWYSKVRKGTV